MAAPKRKLTMNKGKIKKIKLNHVIVNKYLYDSGCSKTKLCFKNCKQNCIRRDQS